MECQLSEGVVRWFCDKSSALLVASRETFFQIVAGKLKGPTYGTCFETDAIIDTRTILLFTNIVLQFLPSHRCRTRSTGLAFWGLSANFRSLSIPICKYRAFRFLFFVFYVFRRNKRRNLPAIRAAGFTLYKEGQLERERRRERGGERVT